MRKAAYARRKAAGLCVGSDCCPRPRRRTALLCDYHYEQHKRGVREYRRRRTVAGMCPVGGCNEPPHESSVYCPTHRAEMNAQGRAYHAKHRARCRASERRWQAARKAAGLCRLCPKPLYSETLCQRCLARQNARKVARKRAEGVKPSTKRCRLCRNQGCRRDVCPLNTSRLAPMTLAELQTRPDARAIAAEWGAG